MHIKANKVQFTAFDVPGKKRFHDLWKKYYKECDAIVWVVDAAGEDMNDVADTLAAVLQAPELRNAIFLIAFNKVDKQGAKNTEELTNALQLGKVMGKRKFRTQEVCAIDGKGIQEGIAWVAGEIKKAKSEKKDDKK
jgi:signal recognition particle receptor subunit beta